MPERPVLWRVSTGGHLEGEWLDRISHFSDDNFVELSWRAERRGEGVVRGLVSAPRLLALEVSPGPGPY